MTLSTVDAITKIVADDVIDYIAWYVKAKLKGEINLGVN